MAGTSSNGNVQRAGCGGTKRRLHRVARVARMLAITALLAVAAHAQFSPGALSKAHAKLDGPTHCTACHAAGGGDRKFRCTACHAEIRQSLAANRGLHPNLMGQGRKEEQCVKCHSDHNGENFVPIRWDVSLDEFDHRKTGYALDGGHVKLKCDRCHTPARIPADARKTILMKDLKRTYLGLSTACVSCHQDEHKGQVGDKCERCHVTAKWKDVTRFDHSTAKYRLAGAHVKTDCVKCHATLPTPAPSGRPMVRYTGMPFAQCVDCHRDVHRGSFAAGCNTCHNDVSWKSVRGTVSSFDHSKTKFPLLGKHGPLACEKCHKTIDYKAPVAHDRCLDCHKDTHQGQFAADPAGADCARCHTADAWKTSTYTVASHAKSTYPLVAKHAAVECAKCHIPAGAATRWKVRHEACVDCHRDVHAGQFTEAGKLAPCERCHDESRFTPARYSLARHQQSRFPLKGAHAAVACFDCHQKKDAAIQYRFNDLSCAGCHQNPHLGSVTTIAAAKETGRCETCHNDFGWRETSSFNHSSTKFPLTGAHRGTACEPCHRATALATGTHKVVFTGAPLGCAGCHEDVHIGQFGTGSCDSCHDTLKWKAAKFDHQKTSFPLTGSHREVPCRDCHQTRKEINGRSVLFYKPAPKECASCHGPKSNQ